MAHVVEVKLEEFYDAKDGSSHDEINVVEVLEATLIEAKDNVDWIINSILDSSTNTHLTMNKFNLSIYVSISPLASPPKLPLLSMVQLWIKA